MAEATSITDFVDRLDKLRNSMREYSEWQKKAFPDIPDVYAGFNNSIIIPMELFSHYQEIWKKIIVTKEDPIVKENKERILYITKWLFNEIVSGMEYNTKRIVVESKNEDFKKLAEKIENEEPVYLIDIMQSAKDKGIFDEDDYKKWATVLKLRAVLYHIGGISDITITIKVNDDLTINLKKGEQVKGKTDFFISLLEEIIPMYHSWVRIISNK